MKIPGIDDCDYLYSLSSRDGETSAYLKVQENPRTGKYHCELIWDDDVGHYCGDIPCEAGPFKTPEDAILENVDMMRHLFTDQGISFVYCNDTRKVVRKNARRKNQ